MEYSKEDLMEAKKQIWGVGENMGTEESKKIWEENAQFWDNAMGDESNEFHREVVRPKVTELLSPNPADYILDIACGNGNYSSYLAQRGASVVAFDYSKKMIELAKRRQSQYAKQIEFCVADATDLRDALHRLSGTFVGVEDAGLVLAAAVVALPVLHRGVDDIEVGQQRRTAGAFLNLGSAHIGGERLLDELLQRLRLLLFCDGSYDGFTHDIAAAVDHIGGGISKDVGSKLSRLTI